MSKHFYKHNKTEYLLNLGRTSYLENKSMKVIPGQSDTTYSMYTSNRESGLSF